MVNRRRAMTLIELLVVIGIIAVLLSLIGIGVSMYAVVSEKKLARTRLESLRNMTEALAATKSADPDVFDDSFYDNPFAPPNWRATLGTTSNTPPITMTSITVNAASGTELEARTLLLMHRLATLPANRTAINNLPVDQKLMPPEFMPPSSSTRNPHLKYIAGSNLPTIPFVLDPWAKPLVYVSREGITGLSGKAAGKRLTSVGPINLSSPIDRVPGDARGFWMSGGPDKNLVTGDDNIYSFEN